MVSLSESPPPQGAAGAARPLSSLLTVPDTARILNVSDARVREMARLGLLPSVKLGRQVRFDPDVLAAWIANGGQPLPGGWRHDQGG